MLRISILCVLLISGTMAAVAQIGFGGRPMDPVNNAGYPEAAVVEFPTIDAVRMRAEDDALLASGVKGPLRFGVNHGTDLSMNNSGSWSMAGDGTSIWRLQLHCPGAQSINFIFGGFVVPEGARVFVWNEAGDLLGAFTQASSGGRPSLGVSPLPSEHITIQYEEPPGARGTRSLHITQVTHGYRGYVDERALGDSGPCNNNTVCPEGDPWRDQVASVAMIVSNGNGYCTGQLINNCTNNGMPYFLTANHCLQGQDPANWTFRFNWESPTCEPTGAGPTGNTVSGATLLENDPGSDVALLQLNTTPPASYNVWYTGWDATGEAPTSTTVIHHPSGDVKKISFDLDAPVQGEFDGAGCWHILAWDDGTTEGGSSGSGLWDPNGRLIGQLFGGQAYCENNVNDYFGRFDLSYPLLTQWLGSCGPPVLDGYDPNAPALTLDVSLLTITGIETNYCGSAMISPVITIRNNGTFPLTQLTILYDIDNGAQVTSDWSGSLATGESTAIPLPDIPVASGVHVFNAACSLPNGGTDGNPVNDHNSKTFHVADPGETITLTINTDDYGSETTWKVEASGATLFSGGPFSDVNGGTTETAQFCLEEACFTFTIMDAVGDGICCQWGNGDYTITDSNGGVLLDGNGNFGTMTATQFCTGLAGINERLNAELIVFPDPGAGLFNLILPQADAATITVRDLLGRELKRVLRPVTGTFVLDLTSLPNGRYLLEATSGDRHLVRSVTIAR